MTTQTPQTDQTHAVVIGASMAGLCAAAAVAPHFDRVTVLDRDQLPAEPAHRRGVPQSKHAHAFQPGGLQALDMLLPGIVDELVAAGAPRGDVTADCTWTVGGIRLEAGAGDAQVIGFTRPFVEHRVRTRVAALPNVTFRDRVQATGPLADHATRVCGVEIEAAEGSSEQLRADLVIDATGKVTKLPTWLAGLGYRTPAEERVTCGMSYLSRRWRLAGEQPYPSIANVVTPATTPHFGVLIAQEDGTHIVTVGGLLDSGPAKNDAAYLEFARNLPDPVIADALVGATPVTELQPSHFPASVRRRYDRLRRFPAGLLAIGDSIAAFNPMYGQGMSVAALEAVALRTMLERGPLDARKFFKAAHRVADVAWKISTGGDLRYPEVEGKRTPDMKFMNRYLDRLASSAHDDPVLTRQFCRVAGFLERPESFFRPRIVRRVLRGSRVTPPAVPARRSSAVTH